MSTAAEKAKELVDKYMELFVPIQEIQLNKLKKSWAKACAIICVDEILATGALNVFIGSGGLKEPNQVHTTYWESVKTELQKL